MEDTQLKKLSAKSTLEIEVARDVLAGKGYVVPGLPEMRRSLVFDAKEIYNRLRLIVRIIIIVGKSSDTLFM